MAAPSTGLLRRISAGGYGFRGGSIWALLLGFPAGGHGFGFSVGAGQKQCFDEPAKSSERIAGEWKVVSGGLLDLDVTVRSQTPGHAVASAAGRDAHLHPNYCLPRRPRGRAAHRFACLHRAIQVTSPNGDHVYSAEHEAAGSFAFYATDTGVYVVCFSNERGTQASFLGTMVKLSFPPHLHRHTHLPFQLPCAGNGARRRVEECLRASMLSHSPAALPDALASAAGREAETRAHENNTNHCGGKRAATGERLKRPRVDRRSSP
jgi:hypothetical protein